MWHFAVAVLVSFLCRTSWHVGAAKYIISRWVLTIELVFTHLLEWSRELSRSSIILDHFNKTVAGCHVKNKVNKRHFLVMWPACWLMLFKTGCKLLLCCCCCYRRYGASYRYNVVYLVCCWWCTTLSFVWRFDVTCRCSQKLRNEPGVAQKKAHLQRNFCRICTTPTINSLNSQFKRPWLYRAYEISCALLPLDNFSGQMKAQQQYKVIRHEICHNDVKKNYLIVRLSRSPS
jgi:hypothetical protein